MRDVPQDYVAPTIKGDRSGVPHFRYLAEALFPSARVRFGRQSKPGGSGCSRKRGRSGFVSCGKPCQQRHGRRGCFRLKAVNEVDENISQLRWFFL
jgi:hypothetical protein